MKTVNVLVIPAKVEQMKMWRKFAKLSTKTDEVPSQILLAGSA
jgi:hypothetical protein